MEPVSVIVMSKPAVPGLVKTRLIGPLTPVAAARIHAAMLACVLERASMWIAPSGGVRYYLATNPLEGGRVPGGRVVSAPPNPCRLWQCIEQGGGDLGQRLTRVWRAVGGGPAVFLGTDSPDVPAEALGSVAGALGHADLAVGPVTDGGYWTLAARAFVPKVLTGIDWGTRAVYHQTRCAAKNAGLRMAVLRRWHDVDEPKDLRALRRRLVDTREPALTVLRSKLNKILQGNANE